VSAAEEVGVGSGDGSGDGVGVCDGAVGDGDGDGDAGGGDDEERDGLGRGELGRGEGDGDEAEGSPAWGEDDVLGAATVGRVDEECLPGDGAAADASVLGGCVDEGGGLCLPAPGCTPLWASKCSSARKPPAPTSATTSVAAPATTYVRRGRAGREPARPG
jgi:hypothetical protein